MNAQVGGQAPQKGPAAVDGKSSVERIECACVALAMPSPVLARILEVAADPKKGAREVVRLVECDAGLAMSILKLANSAAYLRMGPSIDSIRQAVVRLGLDEVVRLAVTRLCSFMQVDEVPGYGLVRKGLWVRSIRTAVAAASLARRFGSYNPAVAYTAGLLADVGKLVLGAELANIGGPLPCCPEGFDRVETELVGVDHATVGSFLAQTWGLPNNLVEAIRLHHHPSNATEGDALPWLVHVGDTMAAMLGTDAVDGMDYPVDPGWERFVPLDELQLEELLTAVARESDKSIAMLA